MGSSGNSLGNCVLIAGLGNPGSEYADTRHNIGFMVLDRLAGHLPKKNFEEVHGCSSRYLRGTYAGRPLFLQKPETFMNLSGEAVAALMKREEIDPRELLVVYDDMDLELGRLRIRERGSCGGHNGIRSIVEHLGTEAFPRLRVGIGHRKDGKGVDHVLSPFDAEERIVLEKVLAAASDALVLILRRGIKQAMNSYNPLDFSADPETDTEKPLTT